MRVRFTPRVNDYLAELEAILYEKEYFGFEESAREYVHEMIGEIMTTLPTRVHRPVPRHFDPEGKGVWYATFRRAVYVDAHGGF